MLQAKMGGADFVKIQLGNNRKPFDHINVVEFAELKLYAGILGIELFASVFSEETLGWCGDLDYIKIASRTLRDDPSLCDKIVDSAMKWNKTVFISNGYTPDRFQYKGENIKYFYCIPEYPASRVDVKLDLLDMPMFNGYSDHTRDTYTCKRVILMNQVEYIEKHFTLSVNLQSEQEKGHAGAMTFEDLLDLQRFNLERAVRDIN